MVLKCSQTSFLPEFVPPLAPNIDDVTEAGITVSWIEPEATYDRVIINCTSMNGGSNDIINVSRDDGNSGTCEPLTAGGLYNVTLSTVLDIGTTEPATIMVNSSVTTCKYCSQLKFIICFSFRSIFYTGYIKYLKQTIVK